MHQTKKTINIQELIDYDRLLWIITLCKTYETMSVCSGSLRDVPVVFRFLVTMSNFWKLIALYFSAIPEISHPDAVSLFYGKYDIRYRPTALNRWWNNSEIYVYLSIFNSIHPEYFKSIKQPIQIKIPSKSPGLYSRLNTKDPYNYYLNLHDVLLGEDKKYNKKFIKMYDTVLRVAKPIIKKSKEVNLLIKP